VHGSALERPAYTVRLEVFEGPLDLLLHLIRREQVDIYDIPIARITQQYLDHLEGLGALDLDMASEFLVMAATLMDIKSRMLLPRASTPEVLDPSELVDPRRELVERLLEYSRYKEAARQLAELAEHSRKRHARFGGPGGPLPRPARPAAPPGAEPSEGKPPESLSVLVAALQRVLRELGDRPTTEVPREPVSVAEKIEELVRDLVAAGEHGLDFVGVLRRSRTRREAVVVFLALLELWRQGKVKVVQTGPFGPLRVWAAPDVQGWRWPSGA